MLAGGSGVAVSVGVKAGSGVLVAVGVLVGASVGVWLGVVVAVLVGVLVGKGVLVAVSVAVALGMSVGVSMRVDVAAGIWVGVGVQNFEFLDVAVAARSLAWDGKFTHAESLSPWSAKMIVRAVCPTRTINKQANATRAVRMVRRSLNTAVFLSLFRIPLSDG